MHEARVLLAKRPDHIWMIDFTRVGGIVRPLWIGAVIDAFSRRVLAVGAVRGGQSSQFAVRLLRDATRRNRAPRWLVPTPTLTACTLSVRFQDGDHRLPVLRLRNAA